MHDELETVLAEAAAAAAPVAAAGTTGRRAWLCAVADALEAASGELLPLAHAETHLPEHPRLAGELVRTTFQLRFLGDVIAEGSVHDAVVDTADPDWPMGPRPDLRRHQVPLGPVLVFAAGNFPFAFSVAGGDTAAALAAGCPVVVKAHPGHPELSRRTAAIVRDALRAAGAPDGAFALVEGVETGVDALRDPRIAAAAFTGSVHGGRALHDIAAARPVPIPFFGELGSVNPVVVTPSAAAGRPDEIVSGLVGSATLGAGQFCTQPGVVFVPAGSGLEGRVQEAIAAVEPQPMLTAAGAQAFAQRRAALAAHPGVHSSTAAGDTGDGLAPRPSAHVTTAAALAADPDALGAECFGPSTLLVTWSGTGELHAALRALGGALTATVHGNPGDPELPELLPLLAGLAGRLVWNGWPTGVTVSWAQQHGGPYPATTAPSTTSVGAGAVSRFLRPVAWQGFPQELLPPELRDDDPGVPQRRDGVR